MKIFKKAALVILALCMTFAFTGCFGGGGQTATAKLEMPVEKDESGVEIQSEFNKVSDAEFPDDIDGLCEYMKENYCVAGDRVQMSYDVIGAKDGYKYVFTYEGKTIQVELYEYDERDMNAEAQIVFDGIEKDGKFTVLDKEIDGYLNETKKYMMIYSDEYDEKVENQRARAIEIFSTFKALG